MQKIAAILQLQSLWPLQIHFIRTSHNRQNNQFLSSFSRTVKFYTYSFHKMVFAYNFLKNQCWLKVQEARVKTGYVKNIVFYGRGLLSFRLEFQIELLYILNIILNPVKY